MTLLRSGTVNLLVPANTTKNFSINLKQYPSRYRSIDIASDQDISFTTNLVENISYVEDDTSTFYTQPRIWGDISLVASDVGDYLEINDTPKIAITNNNTADAHVTLTFIRIVQ